MAGYSQEFISAHAAKVKAEEEATKELKRRDDAAGKEYQAGLSAKRAAEEANSEARIDAGLAPEKASAKRAWLFDHPSQTAEDFELSGWPLLRATLVEARHSRDAIRDKYLDQARAAGRIR